MKPLLAALALLLLASVAGVGAAIAFVPDEAPLAQDAPGQFWTENICPQDVTAPPITCTFLRTDGATVRVPLVDPTGYTYGMILIDAGHVTFVQATPTPSATTLLDLNSATVDEMIAHLPRDDYGQPLSLYEANAIVYGRGTAGYFTLDSLPLEPSVVAVLRACQCTVQR